MKLQKVLSRILALCLAGAMLAGCAGGSSSGNAADSGKIIIFQQKSEIYDPLLQLAADYESETGIEVEVWQIAGDDYYTNLKTYLSSESGPTVFSLNGSSEVDELEPYLVDLGGLSFVGDIQQDLLAVRGGKTLGIPMTAEGFGLVYNTSMVDPGEIAGTDALVSFIAQQADAGITGVGLSEEAYFLIGQMLNVPFALQPDPGSFCRQVYDSEVNIGDVAEFKEFAAVFAAIREHQRNPLESTYDSNCGDFATGKAASIHQGNWCYSLLSGYDMDFDMAVAPLPLGGNRKVSVGVPSVWCVNNDASEAEQQLGLDFLEWLHTSETGIRYLMDEFGFIPVVAGMESQNMDPLSASIAQYIASGEIIPWTFNEYWPANIIITHLAPIAQEYFTSDMDEAAFLAAINDAFVLVANQ